MKHVSKATLLTLTTHINSYKPGVVPSVAQINRSHMESCLSLWCLQWGNCLKALFRGGHIDYALCVHLGNGLYSYLIVFAITLGRIFRCELLTSG